MEHAHEDDVHCVLNISTRHANAEALTDNLSNYLITGGADKKVNVWDLRQLVQSQSQSQSHPNEGEERTKEDEELYKPLITLDVDDVVLCMDFCPQNPRYLAVGTASGEIDLFDLLAVGNTRDVLFLISRKGQKNISFFVISVIGMYNLFSFYSHSHHAY